MGLEARGLGVQPTQAVGSGPGVLWSWSPASFLKEGLRGKLETWPSHGCFFLFVTVIWLIGNTDISNGRKTVVSECSVPLFLLPDALFSVRWCRK